VSIVFFLYHYHTVINDNVIKKNSSDFYRFLFIVAFVILPLRLFVVQPFIVSGESMYPTFENRDYLIVDALSHHMSDPKRGEVVIFRYPFEEKRYFIKRVIGLPGETVEIVEGSVRITNKENPEGFTLKEPYTKLYSDGGKKVTLSADEFFVMGDNRGVSSDSRVWGPLHREYLVGHPLLRLFPIENISFSPGSLEKFTEKSND